MTPLHILPTFDLNLLDFFLMSSLYILERRASLELWFANIFLQAVAQLFTLPSRGFSAEQTVPF